MPPALRTSILSRTVCVRIAYLALAAMPAAHAAHPYLTDDSGTQGKGNWQIELMAEHIAHEASVDLGAGSVRRESRQSLFTPVLTCGLRDDLDVAVGMTRLHQRTNEGGAIVGEARGRGDSTLELKWRFYDSGALSLALKPGLTLPTGDEHRGLGSGKVSWSANFILTWDANPWVLLANVAYHHSRYALSTERETNHADLWRASAGIAYAIAGGLRLVGEAGVRTNQARGDPFSPLATGRWAMLGVIYSPAEKLDFDLGVRRALNSAEPDRVLLAGATLRW